MSSIINSGLEAFTRPPFYLVGLLIASAISALLLLSVQRLLLSVLSANIVVVRGVYFSLLGNSKLSSAYVVPFLIKLLTLKSLQDCNGRSSRGATNILLALSYIHCGAPVGVDAYPGAK